MANFYIQLADRLVKLESSFTDLINNPFVCDNSGEFNLSDENGNVIAKFDKKGLHVTEVDATNVHASNEVEVKEHKLTLKADKEYVDDEISKLQNKLDNIVFDDASGSLTIVDESGNIVATVDKDGIHSIEMTAIDEFGTAHYLTRKADLDVINNLNANANGTGNVHQVSVTVKQTGGKVSQVSVDDSNINFTKLVDNPISGGNDGELIIIDDQNRIGLKLDSDGLQVKDVTAGLHILSAKSDKTYVDTEIDKLEETITPELLE